jgi:hypothetical protein
MKIIITRLPESQTYEACGEGKHDVARWKMNEQLTDGNFWALPLDGAITTLLPTPCNSTTPFLPLFGNFLREPL